MKIFAKSLGLLIICFIIFIYVFWNFFPLTRLSVTETGEKVFTSPGIYVSQKKNINGSFSGNVQIDYARMSINGYKSLLKVASEDNTPREKNIFLKAIDEINSNAKISGGLDNMIKREHRNFILF